MLALGAGRALHCDAIHRDLAATLAALDAITRKRAPVLIALVYAPTADYLWKQLHNDFPMPQRAASCPYAKKSG
jgi:hypothetical protein